MSIVPHVFPSTDLGGRLLGALDVAAVRLNVRIGGHALPAGGAVLVTNHAFGFDAAFLMARIEHLYRRRLWVLGEHAWWRVPIVRRLARAVGTVDGTPENADRLLGAGELVLVLPGGLREAMKPNTLRYRLLWGHRYGFVRAAIRNRVPIVPIASIGPEDLVELIGDAFARGRRFHLPFPLPRPTHLLRRPLRMGFRYVIGEPIEAHDASEPAVRRIRREVEGSLHEMFEEALAEQIGYPDAR